MLIMNQDEFNAQKARWRAIEAHLLSELDQSLVETLKLLNQHPDLVTIFSCEGHPDQPEWRNTYLLCGIRNTQVAFRYYELIKRHLKDTEFARLSLKFTTRQSILHLPAVVHYPAVIFDYRREDDSFPSAFEVAARQLIEELQ